MPVAQGLLKQTVFAKQSALGTPATTAGRIMRRTNATFTLNRDTFESNEIVSHQQSTGANAGIVKVAGKLDALISPLTQSLQFASLLRKDFAAPASAITTLSLTIGAASSGLNNVTRASGSWLTDGLKVGDVARITAGSVNAANLNNNILVVSITSATVFVGKVLSGTALVAEGPIASCTVTLQGKKTYTPTTGHTNDYWTVEECYADLARFEQFTDCKIAKADITIPATGNATVSFDVPGLNRTRSGAATVVSPSAETTTNVLTAVNGAVTVNGVVTTITGASVTIDGNIAPGEAEVGSNAIGDLIRGEVMVSGSFTSKFTGVTLQDLYDNQTVITLVLAITDGTSKTADFVTISIPQLKIMGDAADDGEAKEIIRTYPFTAQIPSSSVGGALLAHFQTICQITDSQAA
jgi:hypothetical protein